jgi:hypothetical protein
MTKHSVASISDLITVGALLYADGSMLTQRRWRTAGRQDTSRLAQEEGALVVQADWDDA